VTRRGFARRWSVLVSIRIVLVKSSDFVQETQLKSFTMN